jgi:hypothetical protein
MVIKKISNWFDKNGDKLSYATLLGSITFMLLVVATMLIGAMIMLPALMIPFGILGGLIYYFFRKAE